MASYRFVVRHVRYWRGTPHRWSTVWPFQGTLAAGNYGAAIAAMKGLDGGLCYSGNAIATGGIYEIDLYNAATGGVPIASAQYFAWNTPAAWVAYTSGGWPSVTTPASSVAESALVVEWAAGLSSKGKPVTFKKWFHAVPETPSTTAGPELTSAQTTSLANYAQTQLNAVQAYGVQLGSPSRLAATLPTVRATIGNHQMPKGRKRKLSGSSASAESNYSKILEIIQGEATDGP